MALHQKNILTHDRCPFKIRFFPDPGSFVSLTKLEEQTFHAKSQIVIVSLAFLEWVYSHPGLMIGNLFKDSTKVIGLLLGVTKDHVRPEHQAELLTFACWKHVLTIKAEDNEALTLTLVKAVASISNMTLNINNNNNNNNSLYVEPRPTKKFRIWPPTGSGSFVCPEQNRILIFLSEKISTLDKIVIVLDIFAHETDDCMAKKVFLERSKDWTFISDSILEITFPTTALSSGRRAKMRLEIGSIRWTPEVLNMQIRIRNHQLEELDEHLANYLDTVVSHIFIENNEQKISTLKINFFLGDTLIMEQN
jgi:hypothetical protein